jgi:hypothetical protein
MSFTKYLTSELVLGTVFFFSVAFVQVFILSGEYILLSTKHIAIQFSFYRLVYTPEDLNVSGAVFNWSKLIP